jgi:hypothetical protein
METTGRGAPTDASPTADNALQRYAGDIAVAVAIGGVAYSISFVLSLKTSAPAVDVLTPLFLLLGGLGTSAVLVALYQRLAPADSGVALWALVVGIIGAFGALVHGGFDLANAINPPGRGAADFPNAVDPRGLLTFGATAVALALFALLMRARPEFPARLRSLGFVLAVLMLLLYLGRLIILDAENPFLLGTAAITGLIVSPLWFAWLGIALRRSPI